MKFLACATPPSSSEWGITCECLRLCCVVHSGGNKSSAYEWTIWHLCQTVMCFETTPSHNVGIVNLRMDVYHFSWLRFLLNLAVDNCSVIFTSLPYIWYCDLTLFIESRYVYTTHIRILKESTIDKCHISDSLANWLTISSRKIRE